MLNISSIVTCSVFLQKKIMLRKAKKAGLTISNSTTLSDLGELVTELSVQDLKKIVSGDIKRNLKDLQKQASKFSTLQKKAIIKNVCTIKPANFLGFIIIFV